MYLFPHCNTHDNPHHRNPHSELPSRLLREDKRQDTSREAAQVVDGHDDALESWTWMVECIEEIGVSHYPTEYTLIISEENKRQLTSDRNRCSELEARAIPVEVRCSNHGGDDGSNKS